MPSNFRPRDDGLPRNESELLHQRPPSHRDGVFPRRLLIRGERILFETRPPSLARSAWAFGLVLFFLASSAIWIPIGVVLALDGVPLSPTTSGVGIAALGAVGSFFWGGILIILLRSRRSTAYALTSQRVLAIRGFWTSELQSAYWEQVERMYIPSTSPTAIAFEVRTSGAGPPGAGSGRRTIVWEGITAGPRTYEFAQTAFALEAARTAVEADARRKRVAVLAERVRCEYCGNLVAVTLEGPRPPTCPRCAAPLPSSPPAPAPVRAVVSEADHIPYLAPVVSLGRDAIGWFRWVAVAWALVTLLTVVDLLPSAFGIGPGTDVGPAFDSALVIVVLVGYFLWAQSLRKWAGAVRTLRDTLPEGSAWRIQVVRPLGRRLWASAIGFVGSLVLIGAAIASIEEASLTSVGGSPPPLPIELAVSASLLGLVAAIVIGQLSLVSSYPEIAAGSGVRSVVRPLAVGRRVAGFSLLAGFWPVTVLLVSLVLGLAVDSNIPYLMLAGLAGPVGLFVGVTLIARGLDEWVRLASSYSWGSPGDLVRGAYVPADRVLYAPGRRPGRAPGLYVGIVVVAAVAVTGLLLAAGWVGPGLERVPTDLGASSPRVEVPLVVVPAKTVWNIPVGYYYYDEFPLHQNGTFTGSFNSSGLVLTFVMDSLQFVGLQSYGRVVSYQYATGNVTQASIHVALGWDDRYYIVVENEDPSAAVSVLWTAQGVVDFNG